MEIGKDTRDFLERVPGPWNVKVNWRTGRFSSYLLMGNNTKYLDCFRNTTVQNSFQKSVTFSQTHTPNNFKSCIILCQPFHLSSLTELVLLSAIESSHTLFRAPTNGHFIEPWAPAHPLILMIAINNGRTFLWLTAFNVLPSLLLAFRVFTLWDPQVGYLLYIVNFKIKYLEDRRWIDRCSVFIDTGGLLKRLNALSILNICSGI